MLNEKVKALLNQQINKEFYSAYLYLDFADYFEDRFLINTVFADILQSIFHSHCLF